MSPATRRAAFMQPHLPTLDRVEALFRRWGWMVLLAGRFIGPLRATLPFVAGMLLMPWPPFLLVSAISALLWVPVLLAPGVGVSVALALFQSGHVLAGLGVVALLGLGIAVAFLALRRLRARMG